MDNLKSQLAKQIVALSKEGLMPEQICESFQDITLSPEDVMRVLASSAALTRATTVDQLVDSFGTKMVEILAEIAMDDTKSESARVKAASVILERKGCMPIDLNDEFSERFRKMQELKKGNDEKILQLPSQQTKVA